MKVLSTKSEVLSVQTDIHFSFLFHLSSVFTPGALFDQRHLEKNCEALLLRLFNSAGNFEKCVTLLRDKHKSQDLSPVVQSIFSHASVAKKNLLTIMLIVSK